MVAINKRTGEYMRPGKDIVKIDNTDYVYITDPLNKDDPFIDEIFSKIREMTDEVRVIEKENKRIVVASTSYVKKCQHHVQKNCNLARSKNEKIDLE